MKKNHFQSLQSAGLHLIFFVFIEIIFVFILFREIPETNIFTAIGIGHSIYRGILLLAAFAREKARKIWQRFLATYLPVLAHLIIHLWIGIETLHTHADDHHSEQETIWLVLGVIATGIFIYRGEKLLHTKFHCDTHHHKAHEKCCSGGHDECEEKHLEKH